MNATELMALSEKATAAGKAFVADPHSYERLRVRDMAQEDERRGAVSFIRSPEFAEMVKNAEAWREFQRQIAELPKYDTTSVAANQIGDKGDGNHK
jgi:hypothetical protein